jgi:hypothetical protein
VEQVESAPPAYTPWAVPVSEEEALTLIGHLLSSAELCLYEPELYGSFRLLDAASRFVAMLASKDPARQDGFLYQLQQEIDQKKTAMMYDPDGFRAFVREVPVLLATRLKEYARAVEGSR